MGEASSGQRRESSGQIIDCWVCTYFVQALGGAQGNLVSQIFFSQGEHERKKMWRWLWSGPHRILVKPGEKREEL